MNTETLTPPVQMQPENLSAICIKALRHARSENVNMLLDTLTLQTGGGEAYCLPAGFTCHAFDRLAYDTPEDEPQLKADLTAIADWRRPIDGERALVDHAVATGMVLNYESARRLFGKTHWSHVVIGNKWRISPMPMHSGFAVVPK